MDSRIAVVVGTWLTLQAPIAVALDRQQGAPKSLQCIHVRSEARYGAYGYDHVVEVENGCDSAVSCTVKTDVSPEPTSVNLAPKQSTSVITFRGSPSREFTPDVQCKPQA